MSDNTETSYRLEKFNTGDVYFLRLENPETNTASVECLCNVEEVREHAEYILNILICKNYEIHNIPLHGSFLNLYSILQVCANVLNHAENVFYNIKRNEDLDQS